MIRTITIMAALLLLTPSSASGKPSVEWPEELTITVRVSPESSFATVWTSRTKRPLVDLRRDTSAKEAGSAPLTDVSMTIRQQGNETSYRVETSGHLFDEQKGERLLLKPAAANRLRTIVHHLRGAHYGELLSWNEARTIVRNKTMFDVIDPETGLQFRVQRRAGSSHADVQPLTKKDTSIMKKIYGGQWSWQRKAILVRKDGRLLAASMHGMPHGGDGIPGNNFSGHFCIHFLDSTTHRNKQLDPAHQLMVHKAAGRLDEYFSAITPEHVLHGLIHALNTRDVPLLQRFFVQGSEAGELAADLAKSDRQINFRLAAPLPELAAEGRTELGTRVTVWIEQAGKNRSKRTLDIRMVRDLNSASSWVISYMDGISFTAPTD